MTGTPLQTFARKRHVFVRATALLVSAVIALAGLGGCFLGGAPISTEDLLVRYIAQDDKDNLMVTGDVDMTFTTLGQRIKIPVAIDFKVAQNSAHGTLVAHLSDLSLPDYTMEVYAELQDKDLFCYLGTQHEGSTTWQRWTIDMTKHVDITTLTDLLSASELIKIAKESDNAVAFELSVPTTAVLDAAFSLCSEPVAIGDMNEHDMRAAVEDDQILFDFTADCLLRSASTDIMCNYVSKGADQVSIAVKIDPYIVCDKYGQTDPSSVRIPDEVRTSATPTETPIDIVEILGDNNPLGKAVLKAQAPEAARA